MKLRWIGCLPFLGLLSLTQAASEKSVITTLNAKWQHTSFLMEISEFLAKENEEYFWNFVEKILANNDNKEIRELDTQEKEYELGLRNAELFLTKARFNLLKFALALRLNSPKIQLYRQIASEYSIGSACPLFVDINNEITCKLDEIDSLLANSNERSNPTTYSIDHFYKSNNVSEIPVAILYGNIGKTSDFSPFHSKLLELANEGKLLYIIRHFDLGLEQHDSSNTVGLSGYGIELAIKNTEYKAIDDSKIDRNEEVEEESDDFHGFNFKTLRKNNENLVESLQQFKLKLSEMEELAPLKQWEVADMSYQAAQKIMDVIPEEALKQLTDISQNFPTRARLLVQTKVKKAFRDEVGLNQQYMSANLEIGEGDNALFINGINIDVDSLDIFQLFNTISKEESLANAFFGMGFRREYLSILYNMDLSEDKATTYAIDYREAYPEYINDLDKEKQYSEWGNSVKLLLQPYFPGMIRPIARNLFTLITIIDLTAPETKSLLKTIHSLYVHQVPIRFGFVFVVNETLKEDFEVKKESGKENVGVALLNLYNFAKSDKTAPKALDLLIKVLEEYSGRDLTVENVHKFFKKRFADQSIEDVFEADSDYDTGRTAGQTFLRRSGLQKLPKVLLNGIVLDDSMLHADKIEEGILMQVMKQTYPLQKAVMSGKLTNKDNVQNWIMNQPDVLPRVNNRLLREPTDSLALFDVTPCKTKTFKEFSTLKTQERAQCILENAKYLSKGVYDDTKWLNIWLVGDLNTARGRSLLFTGLKALKKSNSLRVGFIQNGNSKDNSAASLIYSIIQSYPDTIAKQMLNKLLSNEKVLNQALKGEFEKILVNGVDVDSFKKNLHSFKKEQFAIHEYFSKNELKLSTGEMGVVVNGMFYGPFESSEIFEIDDFVLLEKIFERKGAKAIAKQIDEWGVEKEGGKSSNVVLRAMSVIGKYAARKKRQFIQFENDSESIVNVLAQDGSRPVIDVVAVVDPLSRGAQKLAPILQVLTNVLNCDLKLAMNPKGRLSELPLKRFYRYVLNEEPAFNSQGEILTPSVSFEDLPAKQLFTLNINSPDSWMVQPRFADYDLDNIKMETVRKSVVAKFELVNILLDGHCFDEVSGNPPRGLQYVLGTVKNPNRYDTIVMANLGYFQLKAAPGAWILRLREGKSLDIYEVKSCTESEGQTSDEAKVLIDSFVGKTVRIRVAKRSGMEKRNLLTDSETTSDNVGFIQDEEEDTSIWSSISNKLTGGEKYDKINIFSLASGHLYERFLRIMILSVIKNTKHPVKFWLLNNYLSPHFREALPKMSKKYGFEFELIEYKWPRWLHQQTEKQRIMWGYKILFLDVLFPLDVKKIIFVDADQVVRTDMMELMNLDLDGAPYGYTPFCESRANMDGFRFWKQGYWRNHLAGRKYHISALYVVDLVKFRQIAAGDRLRGQYQGLSSDPNSLSNLDQDLPNNMIHQVRIKSLPQEWLWCETWCEDKSKATAKTIDLCNNPQTKEPKLDSAVRIIPEWTAYDNEIKQVLDEKEVPEDEDIKTNTGTHADEL